MNIGRGSEFEGAIVSLFHLLSTWGDKGCAFRESILAWCLPKPVSGRSVLTFPSFIFFFFFSSMFISQPTWMDDYPLQFCATSGIDYMSPPHTVCGFWSYPRPYIYMFHALRFQKTRIEVSALISLKSENLFFLIILNYHFTLISYTAIRSWLVIVKDPCTKKIKSVTAAAAFGSPILWFSPSLLQNSQVL